MKACLHDEFVFGNAVSQVIQFSIADEDYYLYSFTEPIDHFGSVEDVAVWTFTKERYPLLENKSFISTPVNETITDIILVQENQQLFHNDEQIYNVWVTRGLIFELGDHQIAFEKDVWFSEDIIVLKGYDLADRFNPTDDFAEDWEKGYMAKCVRQSVSLKQ